MSDPFSRLAARMDAITVRKMGKTSVITTWSYDALGAGAEMVLSLSGMGVIENAGDLEHEVLTPEKS